MEIKELLSLKIKNKASDLHLLVGIPPTIRIDGILNPLSNYPPLTPELIESMIFSILRPHQKESLLANKELDFSFGFGGGPYGNEGRFRANVYFQRGYLSGAFRYLEPVIRTAEQLH